MGRTITILLIITLISNKIYGQEEGELDQIKEDVKELKSLSESNKPGKSGFLLRGYAHGGLEYHEADEELNFVFGAFNPIFLYRQSDKLFFEAELEFLFEDDDLEVGLEFANISYIVSKTLTIRAGKIFVPFGIFVERLHPAWINRLPTAPLGYGHDGVLPSTDLGIEFRGAAYAGNLKYNYSFYLLNGPQLNDGSEHEDDAGKLEYGKFSDNNNNKAVGGRFGIFPFSNSSLELGASAKFATVGERESTFEDISSQLYALDLSYVKAIPAIKSVIDIRAQANWVNVDNTDFIDTEDSTGTTTYTFDNKSTSYFGQISLRPSFVGSNFLKNTEFVARFSNLETPEGALWESNSTKWDFGLNYWLNWRTLIKISYSSGKVEGGHDDEPGEGIDPATREDAFFIHWALGF